MQVTGSGRMEQELANGLMVGHAYSITDIRLVKIYLHYTLYVVRNTIRIVSFSLGHYVR